MTPKCHIYLYGQVPPSLRPGRSLGCDTNTNIGPSHLPAATKAWPRQCGCWCVSSSPTAALCCCCLSPADSGWSLPSSLCECHWPLLSSHCLSLPAEAPALVTRAARTAHCLLSAWCPAGFGEGLGAAGAVQGSCLSLPLLLWMLLPLPHLCLEPRPTVLCAAGCVQGTKTEPKSGAYPHYTGFWCVVLGRGLCMIEGSSILPMWGAQGVALL